MNHKFRLLVRALIILLVSCSFSSIHASKKNINEEIDSLNANSYKLRMVNPDSSMILCRKALMLSRNTGLVKKTGDSYFMVGLAYFYKYNYDSARIAFYKALHEYTEVDYKVGVGDAYIKLSYVFGSTSKTDSSIKCIDKALEQYKIAGFNNGIYDCYDGYIFLYHRINDFLKTKYYIDELISLSIKLSDTAKLANGYLKLGNLYNIQSQVKPAIDSYFKALNLFKCTTDSFGISMALGGIGISYLQQDEYKKAIDYFIKQLPLLRRVKHNFELVKVLENIGQAHIKLNQYNEAFRYFKDALDLNLQMHYDPGIARNLSYLADVHYLRNETQKTIETLGRSMKINRRIDNQEGLANNLILAGKVYSKLGKTLGSEKYLLNALEIGKKNNLKYIISEASAVLHELYVKLGSFNKAYYYLLLNKQITDSIRNNENVKKLTQLEMQYEFDKAQLKRDVEISQERHVFQIEVKKARITRNYLIIIIALTLIIGVLILFSYFRIRRANKDLSSQKQQIHLKNDMLSKALSEKEILLKEIHHRVKNNLQMISSLLNLQSATISDSYIKEIVKEGQSRVKSMALIHQLLYQENNLSKINFNVYIQQLTAFLRDTFATIDKEIELDLKVDTIYFDIETAIPLGLIITELVSNSFKYAFKKTNYGKIEVFLQKNNESIYTLNLKDNGVGLPDNFDIQNTKSLGLRLVNLLSDQLDGEVIFKSLNGLAVELKFKERSVA